MKVLVTGADGVLGSNLVRDLLSRDYKVSVLLEAGKESPTLEGLDIQKFHGNILSPIDVENATKGQEGVIHAAASTSVFPARSEIVNKVNIEGTQNIIDACLKHKIKRLVYVGTANSFCFGSSKDSPGVEKGPYLSVKYGVDYMDSKQKAQELVLDYVKNHNLPALIVNPTFMIGPYDSKPSSGIMVLTIKKGGVPGYSGGGKNFVAVKDAATALANALTMGRIGECYILGNYNLTFKEAFETIAEVVGAKAPSRQLPNFIVVSYGRLMSLLAKIFKFYPAVTKELAVISCENHFYSSEKAQKELLLPKTPLKVAIKECYDWFNENGYLDKKK